MGKAFYSLRTGILANLIFLILAAMILINVIMIKLAENDLIRARVKEGITLANGLALLIQSSLQDNGESLQVDKDVQLRVKVKGFLKPGDFKDFVFVPAVGGSQWTLGGWRKGTQIAVALCRQSIITQETSFSFHGSTWAVIWLGYETLQVSAPVKAGGRVIGALALSSHLQDLYSHLRRTERLILIYILLNTVILLATGMYLLSRVVIRPIQKLLKVTEQFKEGEPLALPPEPSKNEIGQLFHSLKMMLSKLEENKRELKEHIASLRAANEELKRTQEEVIRSEKLASVGRLAAGVAHEVGNPVGVVLGYLDLIKNGELSEPEIKDALERCESEIKRINKIIRQLLDYSRPSPPILRRIGVHALLSETIEMLAPQPIMRNISIETEFMSPQDAVMGDENRLKQVFVNILLNAADAIEEKRKTCSVWGDAKIKISTQNTHGTIKISMQDTGCGIGRDSIERIFDPFYSTKEPGKGTGLGLAVSYRIVEQMGGDIWAESQEGQGATIHVTLPLAKGE
ncbi:MAG: hypothetical protein DRH15_02670 [Deltaproteobacteria bacterium]|nr:MAG: hypothetical protein DRH15_02670 [Deltaproteobacteria bacterium]